MKPFKISFDVEPIGGIAPLNLEVAVDNKILWSKDIRLSQSVLIDCDDSMEKTSRILQFRMQGKTPQHTAVSDGQIISDVCLSIKQTSFDGILIQRYLENNNRYFHDHNGNSEPVCQQFYGIMGCNGTVEMAFEAPVFLWLLENL